MEVTVLESGDLSLSLPTGRVVFDVMDLLFSEVAGDSLRLRLRLRQPRRRPNMPQESSAR